MSPVVSFDFQHPVDTCGNDIAVEFQILETFGTSSTTPAMAWKSDNSGLVAISGTKVIPDQIWILTTQRHPGQLHRGEWWW